MEKKLGVFAKDSNFQVEFMESWNTAIAKERFEYEIAVQPVLINVQCLTIFHFLELLM